MKLRTHITLALLVAAVAASAAHAGSSGTRPNDRAGAIGPATSSTMQDLVERYVLAHAQASTLGTRPNDRAGAIGPAAGPAAPDLVERYVPTQQPHGQSTTKNGAGFDWADAGIGAGGMLGIMLLAGIATLAARQGRRRLAST